MKNFLFVFTTVVFHTLHAQCTFQGDNARSSIYESLSPKSIPNLHWKFKTDCPIVSSPAVGNGLIFIGGAENNLYAIGEKSGHWTHSPAIKNGNTSLKLPRSVHPLL